MKRWERILNIFGRLFYWFDENSESSDDIVIADEPHISDDHAAPTEFGTTMEAEDLLEKMMFELRRNIYDECCSLKSKDPLTQKTDLIDGHMIYRTANLLGLSHLLPVRT